MLGLVVLALVLRFAWCMLVICFGSSSLCGVLLFFLLRFDGGWFGFTIVCFVSCFFVFFACRGCLVTRTLCIALRV